MALFSCIQDAVVVEVHEADARTTLDATRDVLRERAVENNVVWQILADQAGHASYGRYWWISQGDAVLGAAVHFPPRARALLTPMPRDAAVALAQAIRPPLPGVAGDPATATAFAGSWATIHRVSARPVDAQLLYQLSTIISTAPVRVPGTLRRARRSDRQLVVEWRRASANAGSNNDAGQAVDRALARDEVWLWDVDGPVAMAIATRPVGGVSRIHAIFTPSESRRRGYGTALVDRLSRQLLQNGIQCALQTRLTNPVAHTLYQKIGYEPIGEILAFRWEP